MDYEGQSTVDSLYQYLLYIFASLAFAVGFVQQSFGLSMKIGLAGLVVTCTVCVPNWPCFNRRPITWRPAVGADEVTCEEYADDAAAVAAANAERIAQNIAAKIKERSKAK